MPMFLQILGRILSAAIVGGAVFAMFWFFDPFDTPEIVTWISTAIGGLIGFVFGIKSIEAVLTLF